MPRPSPPQKKSHSQLPPHLRVKQRRQTVIDVPTTLLCASSYTVELALAVAPSNYASQSQNSESCYSRTGQGVSVWQEQAARYSDADKKY